MVPENTGKNTSPVACFAACLMGIFPLPKIRWVFSITTIASSTTIPKASKKENNTIMFMVKPILGIIINAIAIDNGTDKATNMALVNPIKNMRIMVTKTKPITMVLIKSCNVSLVLAD